MEKFIKQHWIGFWVIYIPFIIWLWLIVVRWYYKAIEHTSNWLFPDYDWIPVGLSIIAIGWSFTLFTNDIAEDSPEEIESNRNKLLLEQLENSEAELEKSETKIRSLEENVVWLRDRGRRD